ncbi:GATA transcription factor 1 [Andrographis paniculata]|uniref:GATA transcription factor 1 n=1 Tax=Andrographis paniculata TaxID=175694 RepID=UPI0021E79502|nr:GATA transcription factor 1 [Andrographis paniculata]
MELDATIAALEMATLPSVVEPALVVTEDILDFSLDGTDELKPGASTSSSSGRLSLFPEFEEELEWLSNKDAFPSVDTCFGILADNPELVLLNHQSPVSVLENSSNSNTTSSSGGATVASYCSSLKVPESFPVRSRSKRLRRKRSDLVGLFRQQHHHHCLWATQVSFKTKQERPETVLPTTTNSRGAGIGRRCLHCQSDKTPQWRAGPMGPKTLCNACGVRYKSGRLLPEYRPASSPTFSSKLHSNSHRKVVEMRKKKQLPVAVGESCGYI